MFILKGVMFMVWFVGDVSRSVAGRWRLFQVLDGYREGEEA